MEGVPATVKGFRAQLVATSHAVYLMKHPYFVSHFMSHNYIIKKSKVSGGMGQYETRVDKKGMS